MSLTVAKAEDAVDRQDTGDQIIHTLVVAAMVTVLDHATDLVDLEDQAVQVLKVLAAHTIMVDQDSDVAVTAQDMADVGAFLLAAHPADLVSILQLCSPAWLTTPWHELGYHPTYKSRCAQQLAAAMTKRKILTHRSSPHLSTCSAPLEPTFSTSPSLARRKKTLV